MMAEFPTLLSKIASAAARRPVAWLTAIALLTLIAAVFAAITLKVDDRSEALMPEDVAYLRNFNAFIMSFPALRRWNIIVIDGDNPDHVLDAARRLSAELSERRDVFRKVWAPQLDPFLQRRIVQGLDATVLDDMVDRLASAQPALTVLAASPGLSVLAELAEKSPTAAGELAGDVLLELDRMAQGKPVAQSWTRTVFGDDIAPGMAIVIAQGFLDERAKSAEKYGEPTIRQAAIDLGITAGNGLRLRMTGRGALSYAELQAALNSVAIAGALSLVLLIALLWIGFRSIVIVATVLVCLVAGLILTAGFAALAVGTLNLLSITFAVLFIGLGVDFLIHFTFRYLEESSVSPGDAIPECAGRAAEKTGSASMLCAATSAIGFLAFMTTDYKGLAQLGLISAGGLAIAAFLSVTALPAAFSLLGIRGNNNRDAAFQRVAMAIGNNRRSVVGGFVVLTILAVFLVPKVGFDFNTLNLKGAESEAVQTYRDLQEAGFPTYYSLSILVDDMAAADTAVTVLRGLPGVRDAIAPADFIPKLTVEKQDALLDAGDVMWPVFAGLSDRQTSSETTRRSAAARLANAFSRLETKAGSETARRIKMLGDDALARLESRLFEYLPTTLAVLQNVLSTAPLAWEEAPVPVKEQFVGPDGRVRVSVTPVEDLTDYCALRDFVDSVTALFPTATGLPVLERETGRIVVDAFQKALIVALLAVAAVLFTVLRRFRDVALAMTPILLAGLFTVAAGVVLELPFNFANVVVLPLIMGIGVDSGIHMVVRHREAGQIEAVFASSTPKAVLLSALTTFVSFGTLTIADNVGISSMGVLLSLGMAAVIATTIVLLPAILAILSQSSR